MSKQRVGFKAGQLVKHELFGTGQVIDEWGSIPMVDENGKPVIKKIDGELKPLTIFCAGIYDVRFNGEKGIRSIHRSRLRPVTDVNLEWTGMPEYHSSREAGSFRSVIVHFRNAADADAFALLIGQQLSDKTRFVWFPEMVRDRPQAHYAGAPEQ